MKGTTDKALLLSQSCEETQTLGRALGAALEGGDFVGLVGDLGAGKTELVRGAAQGAGVDPTEVTSPSFALINSYEGRLLVHHVDLYRLGNVEELYSTGYEDLLQAPGAAFLVEWVDKIPRAAPADALRVVLVPGHGDIRHLEVTAVGERSSRLLNRWLARVEIQPGVDASSPKPQR